VIALADLVDYLNGRRDELPPKAVVITIDDGYVSAYRYIFPLLRDRKMPFTVFVHPQIVTAGADAAPGTYRVRVRMTSGSLTHDATLSVVITQRTRAAR
jgi:hypothetical protein